jgi:hypothetical protein
LVPAGALLWTYRSLDRSRALELACGAGPGILLLLAPFIATLLLDCLAWRRLLANLGYRLDLAGLLPVRLSAEAVNLSLFGGPALADGLAPVLLGRRRGVPLAAGLASSLARKCLLIGGQAVWVGVTLVIGHGFLQRASLAVIGVPGLAGLVTGAAACLAIVAVVLGMLAFSGTMARSAGRLLARLPIRSLRESLRSEADPTALIDQHLGRALGERWWQSAGPLGLFALSWAMECVETGILLRLLGVPAGFLEVVAFEPVVSLMRHLVFFIPAGVGIQEVGYLAFFRAAGYPDPLNLSAAFSVLKRSREAIGIGSGYLFLALPEFGARGQAATVEGTW